MKLTSHLRLMQKLRMRGAMSPLVLRLSGVVLDYAVTESVMWLLSDSSYSGPFWTKCKSFSLYIHTTCVNTSFESRIGAARHSPKTIKKEIKANGKPNDSIKNNSGFIHSITVPLLTTSYNGQAFHCCDYTPSHLTCCQIHLLFLSSRWRSVQVLDWTMRVI